MNPLTLKFHFKQVKLKYFYFYKQLFWLTCFILFQSEWRRRPPWVAAVAGPWRTSSGRRGWRWRPAITRWQNLNNLSECILSHSSSKSVEIIDCLSKKSTCEEIYLDMSRLNKIEAPGQPHHSDYLEMERLQKFQQNGTNWTYIYRSKTCDCDLVNCS